MLSYRCPEILESEDTSSRLVLELDLLDVRAEALKACPSAQVHAPLDDNLLDLVSYLTEENLDVDTVGVIGEDDLGEQ